jgi:acetoin utilization protein AcuB
MFVKTHMTPNPITIPPNMSVPDALRLMREKKVRRFPVVDSHGKLVGIVSDKDLLHASPSPATTLAVWEIPELLARLKVEKVMTRDVITISDDAPLEEAASTMADHAIGGLPVMRGQSLVGIITESDLFKVLLDLLGGRRPGARITVSATGAKGTLARISNAIFNAGGDIVGLGVHELEESGGKQWELFFKVQDVPLSELVEAVRPVVDEILEANET